MIRTYFFLISSNFLAGEKIISLVESEKQEELCEGLGREGIIQLSQGVGE